ncbi:MAG TPA: hypothetical protein PKD91_01975 [Bacteroidia bacterium]|nr:hypothetical protein [Bacteroidia bacterium]
MIQFKKTVETPINHKLNSFEYNPLNYSFKYNSNDFIHVHPSMIVYYAIDKLVQIYCHGYLWDHENRELYNGILTALKEFSNINGRFNNLVVEEISIKCDVCETTQQFLWTVNISPSVRD